jgi:cobalt-zinc-cadmium efflux system membrane fusion protein
MPSKRISIIVVFLLLTATIAWFTVKSTSSPPPVTAKESHAHEAEAGDATHVEMDQAKIAKAGIAISTVAPETLQNRLRLYGRIGANEDQLVQIQPRFPGILRSVRKRLGDAVAKDEVIASVESNQSLTTYDARSPIAGTVVEKNVSLGEFVGDQSKMFVVANLGNVWVDLSVYRQDFGRIRPGLPIKIDLGGGEATTDSTIAYVSPLGAPDTQTMLARAVVDNPNGTLRPGLFVTGEVALDPIKLPLAVEVQAIQTMDGRSVVFVREGDRFEARPIEIGRRDTDYAEVLSGLKPGEKYAARNSFVVKAEIGKSAVEEE